jgi:YD repeat-containing protein
VSGGGVTQYGYDPNGNRTSLRKRDGLMVHYAYDALDRLVEKRVPGNGWNVGYGYDLRGLQTSAGFINMGGGVASVYDGFGRLTSTTTSLGGSVRTVAHQYDRDGLRTEIAHPDGHKFWTARDGLGRAAGAYMGAIGSTSVLAFAYDQSGAMTRRHLHGDGDREGARGDRGTRVSGPCGERGGEIPENR